MDEGYWIFVLGYDLLQEELNSKKSTCDDAYLLCSRIIADFDASGENEENLNKPTYEVLQHWITSNKQKYFQN